LYSAFTPTYKTEEILAIGTKIKISARTGGKKKHRTISQMWQGGKTGVPFKKKKKKCPSGEKICRVTNDRKDSWGPCAGKKAHPAR